MKTWKKLDFNKMNRTNTKETKNKIQRYIKVLLLIIKNIHFFITNMLLGTFIIFNVFKQKIKILKKCAVNQITYKIIKMYFAFCIC